MNAKNVKKFPIEKQLKFQEAYKRLEQIEQKISKFASAKKRRIISASDKWEASIKQCCINR